jgi:hypothetical protein
MGLPSMHAAGTHERRPELGSRDRRANDLNEKMVHTARMLNED